MQIFFSVGEPSGDIHGANLIDALKRKRPDIECVGFGGERMAAAGCHLHYPMANRAVMGFAHVFTGLPRFANLILEADRYLRQRRPDAVVLIDCPGFNWWIARRAHAHRIPVIYFVPPQLWAWAGWRVEKVRRFVDHVLCTLPFEVDWYRARGIEAEYVGHPFFDELPRQALDGDFLEAQRQRGGTLIGILPGSRTQEVETNFLSQARAAEIIHRGHPETRFLVACFREAHQKRIEELRRDFAGVPMELFVNKTPEIIEASKMCISVSGSVSLELLYRARPAVILYRVSRFTSTFIRPLVKVKYITLVNLLADKPLFPEHTAVHCESAAIAREILHWLDNERDYASVYRELLALRERVAFSGACDRAAQRILEVANKEKRFAA